MNEVLEKEGYTATILQHSEGMIVNNCTDTALGKHGVAHILSSFGPRITLGNESKDLSHWNMRVKR